MSKTITSILHAAAVQCLEEDGRPTVEMVLDAAFAEYGDEFLAAQERMTRAYAANVVRGMFRDFANDEDDQLAIPGLALPTAIAVNTPERTYYVRSAIAVWPELMAGRENRAENVERAVSRLDRYDDTCNMLRPFMEHDHTVTVTVAVQLLR